MKAVAWALGKALGRGWGSSEAQTRGRIMLGDPCEDGNPMGVGEAVQGGPDGARLRRGAGVRAHLWLRQQ